MYGVSFRPALLIATGANSPIPLEPDKTLMCQAFRRLLEAWLQRPARCSLITPQYGTDYTESGYLFHLPFLVKYEGSFRSMLSLPQESKALTIRHWLS